MASHHRAPLDADEYTRLAGQLGRHWRALRNRVSPGIKDAWATLLLEIRYELLPQHGVPASESIERSRYDIRQLVGFLRDIATQHGGVQGQPSAPGSREHSDASDSSTSSCSRSSTHFAEAPAVVVKDRHIARGPLVTDLIARERNVYFDLFEETEAVHHREESVAPDETHAAIGGSRSGSRVLWSDMSENESEEEAINVSVSAAAQTDHCLANTVVCTSESDLMEVLTKLRAECTSTLSCDEICVGTDQLRALADRALGCIVGIMEERLEAHRHLQATLESALDGCECCLLDERMNSKRAGREEEGCRMYNVGDVVWLASRATATRVRARRADVFIRAPMEILQIGDSEVLVAGESIMSGERCWGWLRMDALA